MARTPLHMFGMKYRVQEYLGLIASGDHDVNAQDADGKTPLHYASEQQQVEVMSALLDAGADPNIRETQYGNTPLSNAIFWVDETGDAVEKMLAKGADPGIANNKGVTPLELVRTSSKPANQRLAPLVEEAAKRFAH